MLEQVERLPQLVAHFGEGGAGLLDLMVRTFSVFGLLLGILGLHGDSLLGILHLDGGPAFTQLMELGVLGLQEGVEPGIGADLRAGQVLAEAAAGVGQLDRKSVV